MSTNQTQTQENAVTEDGGSSRRAWSRSASPQAKKVACEYCSKRKIRCDMLEPSCTNCTKRGKPCVPMARPGRARPTHERIDQLEQANARLRDLITSLGGVLPPGDGPHDTSTSMAMTRVSRERSEPGPSNFRHQHQHHHHHHQSQQQTDMYSTSSDSQEVPRYVDGDNTPSGSRFPYPQNRNPAGSAHGPTSAYFSQIDQRDFAGLTPLTGISESTLSDQATSRAAEQRHMEILNLASGKLDFDGVQPDLAMHLLALHWNRQHFAFLISYRPLFTRDMACGGPYFTRLLLNALFFSVSKFSTRQEVYDDTQDQTTAGRRFLRRVKELLGEALDQSSIPTIQAMLLLSSSLFALGMQSAAWLYNGIAIQMIFDLGLNYDAISKTGDGSISAEELEIRRRVVWAAFIYDKIISLYQGRPVSFDEERMHVPHRFLDKYEEQELWTPFAFPMNQHYPGAPARAIATFSAYCSLSVIMGRVITQIYAERVLPERSAECLRILSNSLSRWKQELSADIAFDPNATTVVPPPHVLSLHMVYHALVILLHRPLVETGAHTTDPSLVSMSWAKCETAAKGTTALLERYRQTFSLARAPYLISYATFVAATIHVRIAAQKGSPSESANLLNVCLDALKENSATNPGVNKMYQSIMTLMARLHVSQDSGGGDVPTSNMSMLTEELDLDAIIRSFDSGQSSQLQVDNGWSLALPWNTTDTGQDNLFGFLQ